MFFCLLLHRPRPTVPRKYYRGPCLPSRSVKPTMSGGCSVSTVIRAQTKCVRMILPSSLSAVAKVSDPVCQEDVPVCRRKSVRPLCQEDVPVCRHEVSDLLCQKCSCLLSRKLRSTVSERFTRFPPGKCGCEICFFLAKELWPSSIPIFTCFSLSQLPPLVTSFTLGQ